jgi:RNA polymerase sigma-70 factor, ECF subfamily
MTTLNKLLSARWLTKKAPSAQSSQAQNKRQIEQMYHTHYVKLRGYAHRLTRSEERAMDLIQDTFVRAHKYLHTFDGQYELSWLKKIMYHIHIDNMSEETKKRAIRGGAAEYQDHLAHQEQPFDLNDALYDHFYELIQKGQEGDERWKETFRELFSDHLYESLLEISDPHRNVLIMSHLLDMPYDEIAKELDCKMGTVMSRLSRARVSLQRAMASRNAEVAKTLEELEGQRRVTKRGNKKKTSPTED